MTPLDRLASIRLFFVCMALLLLACALGGVIPQNEPLEKYHDIFGHISGVWIGRLGLNDVFRSFWFLGLLGLTGLNLIACSIKRFKALKLRPGVLMAHLAVILIFLGGIIRGVYSNRGTMGLEVGKEEGFFDRADGKREPLPFLVRLEDFKVHFWENEKHRIHARTKDGLHEFADIKIGENIRFNPIGISVKAIRFYPQFSIGESGSVSLSPSPENPALELLVTEGKKDKLKPPLLIKKMFVFSKFPDFRHSGEEPGIRLVYEYIPGKIKQFESKLKFIENGRSLKEASISVNSPVAFKGFKFYQSGYDPKNPNFSSLQVSRDISVPFIYSGFGFLLLGLGLAFTVDKRKG